MSKTLNSTLVAMATAGALLVSPVFAAPTDTNTDSSTKAKVEKTVKNDWMSLRQAYEALEKNGYKDSDILSLMRSRFGYIAHVLDGEEKRIRLLINPTTGSVTAENNQYGGQAKGHKHMGAQRHGGARHHQGGRHHWQSNQD